MKTKTLWCVSGTDNKIHRRLYTNMAGKIKTKYNKKITFAIFTVIDLFLMNRWKSTVSAQGASEYL